MRKLTKKFIDRLPVLRELYITSSKLEVIEDDDALSNLKQLVTV